jgi:acyl-CoA thioesterase FadM
MARIKLELPREFVFTTEIVLRITDLNYGGHMGNEVVLQLAHEARVRFLARFGYTEGNIEGRGIIMSDAAIQYKKEAFHGDLIEVQVAVEDFSKKGCDLFYLMKQKGSGREIARLKTGIVFYDYSAGKPVSLPERFRERFDRTRA